MECGVKYFYTSKHSSYPEHANLFSLIQDEQFSSYMDAFYDCSKLTSVYYTGTEVEWNNISISYYNYPLTSAKKYYYSETEPTGEGNYWHYAADGKTILIWTKG